jgi:minor histocompatibility antigen H13
MLHQLTLVILTICSSYSFGFVVQPQSQLTETRFSGKHSRLPFQYKTESSSGVVRGKVSLWAQNSESEVDLNPVSNFISQIFNKPQQKVEVVETEEERQRRLELEKRAILATAEVRRQEQVKEDALPYLFLFSLQFLPLLGTDRIESIIYFLGVAVTTVYVGGRQETIDEAERVSKSSALAAPIGASVALGFIYLLIKTGIDPTSVYAIAVTLFGALAISDISVPIFRNLLPPSFAEKEIEVPKDVAEKLKLDPPTLPLDGLVTLGLGLLCTAAYWAPIAMEQKFILSNVIAWSLAMVSLGSISLGSFQTGAILLAGLFFYDIFWVFGTEVMMTVATKVEAPVKFLYTAPPSETGRAYPFSVLGLGDVVIPGLFVRLMAKVDEELNPTKLSYFTAASTAYALGLSVCFVVNELTQAGQPALLYLDPACIGSALACGAYNGQFDEIINFEEPQTEEESLL